MFLVEGIKKVVFFNTGLSGGKEMLPLPKKKKIVLVVLLQTTIFAASITDRGLVRGEQQRIARYLISEFSPGGEIGKRCGLRSR